MQSSHEKSGVPDYLKTAAKRKRQPSDWPIGRDSRAEAGLKAQIVAEGLSPGVIARFQKLVYRFYRGNRRDLPWRKQPSPWQVLVSEVMLQQTPVDRVLPKYFVFIEKFPVPYLLATATLTELLAAWQGLGYNRRALYLQQAARMIAEKWNGAIPGDPLLLHQLPGIGPYTAGAICAFAFNQPRIFLETNIRAVLLHFFFSDQEGITDKQLLPVAEAVLDRRNPRDWYNALMDYGSDLKRRFPNPSRLSRHHTVQSRFEGSDRQIRGAVLRLLLASNSMTACAVQKKLDVDAERLARILEGMLKEGLVQQQRTRFFIP